TDIPGRRFTDQATTGLLAPGHTHPTATPRLAYFSPAHPGRFSPALKLKKQRTAANETTAQSATGSTTDLATTSATGYTVTGSVWVEAFGDTSANGCADSKGCLVAAYNTNTYRYSDGVTVPAGTLVKYVAFQGNSYSLSLPFPGTFVIVAGRILYEGLQCQFPQLGTGVIIIGKPGTYTVNIDTQSIEGVDWGRYYNQFGPDYSGGDMMDPKYNLCMSGQNKPCFEHRHMFWRDIDAGAAGTDLRTMVVSNADATSRVLTTSSGASPAASRIVQNQNELYAIFIYGGNVQELKNALWITFDIKTGASRIDYMFYPVCNLIDMSRVCQPRVPCPPLRKFAVIGAE
ncbi:MAG: hypothetical protein HYV63_18015, partial [Candidatus Schekmanbacteria bacterium]|nr:hypothetical protein [Candidatus Schekmanbacteria bacterium]